MFCKRIYVSRPVAIRLFHHRNHYVVTITIVYAIEG